MQRYVISISRGETKENGAVENSETFFPTKKDPKKWAEGHAVKGRSEPCHIVQVAEVVAKVKQIPVSEVAEAAWENTIKLFRVDL